MLLAVLRYCRYLREVVYYITSVYMADAVPLTPPRDCLNSWQTKGCLCKTSILLLAQHNPQIVQIHALYIPNIKNKDGSAKKYTLQA